MAQESRLPTWGMGRGGPTRAPQKKKPEPKKRWEQDDEPRRSPPATWGLGRGGPTRVPSAVAQTRRKEEQEQRRTERRQANVSAATRSATNQRDETYVTLTDEQWARLSPEQQQQVQYNADLKEAVDLDRAAAQSGVPSVTGDDKRSYNDALRSIFGSAKGHVAGMTTAPETTAYLTELGLTQADTRGSGIGNYLNMDAALGMEDIAGLAEIVGTVAANPPRPGLDDQDLKKLREASVKASTTLAQRLANGQALLAGSGAVADARSRRAMAWGGAGGTYEQLGADQAYVDNALDILAASPAAGDTSGVASGWEIAVNLMNEDGVTPERQAVIRRAVNDRVNRAIQGGDWITVPGAAATLTPGEVAAALGQV